MERDANGWGTSGGIDHQTPQVDGRCDDLLILSRWVRKELFAQVKFLYNPEVDLRIRGRLFNTFLRDCKDRLVGLKLNANRNSDYKMMNAESLWTLSFAGNNIVVQQCFCQFHVLPCKGGVCAKQVVSSAKQVSHLKANESSHLPAPPVVLFS